MKKQELKWRLGKLPTVEEVLHLLNAKLITQEEAKDILFNKETIEDRDKESLKSEIKFLRSLVSELSKNKTSLIETIKYVETPYKRYDWYSPYVTWCTQPSTYTVSGLTTSSSITNSIGNSSATFLYDSSEPLGFTDIKTF